MGRRCAAIEHFDLVIDPRACLATMGDDIDLIRACATINDQPVCEPLSGQADDIDLVIAQTPEDPRIGRQRDHIDHEQIIIPGAKIKAGGFGHNLCESEQDLVIAVPTAQLKALRRANLTAIHPDFIIAHIRLDDDITGRDKRGLHHIQPIGAAAKYQPHPLAPGAQLRAIGGHTRGARPSIGDQQRFGRNQRPGGQNSIHHQIIRAQINRDIAFARLKPALGGRLDQICARACLKADIALQRDHHCRKRHLVIARPKLDHNIPLGLGACIHIHARRPEA